MIQRAVRLVRLGVPPNCVLMVTFSVKAAEELCSRVGHAFAALGVPPRLLPVGKTFHALAFFWVRRYWRALELGAAPAPLTGDAGVRKFMQRVLEEQVAEKRLEWCVAALRKHLLRPGGADADGAPPSWEEVLAFARQSLPASWRRACEAAEREVPFDEAQAAPARKKRRGGRDAADVAAEEEEARARRAELEAARMVARRAHVYLELRGAQRRSSRARAPPAQRATGEGEEEEGGPMPPGEDPIARLWLGASKKERRDKVAFYLELVRRGRQQRQGYSEYLKDDADVWRRYDAMQRREGRLDFDAMLLHFHRLLGEHEGARRAFHSAHSHLIVDEYQDNSEMQAKLLELMVNQADPQVTVVGDDDQCIYCFRGAEPGNFSRLPQRYEHCTLVDNYRSTANILRVAHVLLEECARREAKTLAPTRETGAPVELWKVATPAEQASELVRAMRARHEEGVPWGEMACLFRCFKAGEMGSLHKPLQQELSLRRVPYTLLGGKGLFELAAVLDALAYLRLAALGSGEHDDEAFVRILNRPKRRLPEESVLRVVEHQRRALVEARRGLPVGLEAAARQMVASGVGVKKSQRASLGSLLALLDELRDACVMAELPAMLLRVWSAAGLDAMHVRKKRAAAGKASRGEEEEEEESEGEEEEEDGEEEEGEESEDDEVKGESEVAPQQRKERSQRRALAPLQGTARDRGDEGVADAGGQGAGGGDSSAMRLPSEVSSLVEVATAFSTEYAARERAAAGSESSLFALCRTYVLDHAAELQLSALPDCVVDELFASRGRGRSVMRAFLTEVAMRSSAADAQDAAAEGSSKVSISTIHRAKGLEWCDVYVPFLNDGLLPMGYREETGNTAQRHKPQCAARRANGHCDLNCARAYREADAHARGTPEERHADEERRLAHVAATRAKDRLVFITVQLRREGAFAARNAMEPSPYERSLRAALPEETLVTRVRGELQDAEE